MTIPTLPTARLHLRPFSEADVSAMHQILSGQAVLRYFPNPTRPTLNQVEQMITNMLGHWQQYGYGLWAVESQASGALLGRTGLQYLPDTAEVEIDFLLGRAFWGQGFATEAGQAALQYGFDQLKVDQVVGIVHPENVASKRVLEKLGLSFTTEAPYFDMTCYRYALKG